MSFLANSWAGDQEQQDIYTQIASSETTLILLDMVRTHIPQASKAEVIAAVDAMLLLLKALLGKAIEG